MQTFGELYGRYLDTSTITRKHLDVAYGTQAAQKLDIYYPEVGEGPLPVVVFFHGGGFFKGDKGRYQLASALSALDLGYAVASVNYRMLPEHPLPAAFEDAEHALSYLSEHATELGVDPGRMAVWGESAGATLAVWAGCKRGVRAIVSWYAAIDVSHITDALLEEAGSDCATLAEYLFGLSGDELAKACKRYDLRTLAESHVPALIALHGTADELVPTQDSIELHEAFSACLAPDKNKLMLVEGGHHGVADYQDERTLATMLDFLDANV